MRPALIALILIVGAAAVPRPRRCPSCRYVRGGRFATPEGAIFAYLMSR